MDASLRAVKCAVLGSPIQHSLSPTLHNAAYAALGLDDWTYGAVNVEESGLADFLDHLGVGWRGLSLTMPLKRAALSLVDSVDPWARQARAVNTIVFADGSRHGHNTDVPGAVAAIRERTDTPPARAVVLGGGATATSMLLALGELGCTTATLLVRDPTRASETLEVVRAADAAPSLEVGTLDADPGEADIVVSTIPAEAQSGALVQRLADVPVVFDVIYDPWPTPLAASVGDDRVLVSGLDLLVHQALLQVRLMTGIHDVPLAVLREAGQEALSRRKEEV